MSNADLPTSTDDPAALVATMPFAVHAGVAIDEASKDSVAGHVDWAPELCTIGGILHGGARMTLADSLGAAAAVLHLPEGASTATVSSHTVLIRPTPNGRVTGTPTVAQDGRHIQDGQGAVRESMVNDG